MDLISVFISGMCTGVVFFFAGFFLGALVYNQRKEKKKEAE